MRELHQKQIIKRRLYSVPVLVVLFIVTGLAIRSTYNIVKKYQESAGHVNILEQKIGNLIDREQQLKNDIFRLGTDEGVDKEIKEKFNVVKDGGKVAIMIDEDDRINSTTTITSTWYKRFWDAIIR